MLDLRNLNTIWASTISITLSQLGLKTAIISPGSRSTPLTLAFAQNQAIETPVIIDERSAAFFALGKAKASGLPVALVCTSGTAGANFYPAIIEAKYSHIPLLVLTADRPLELRDCRAGQTIDQVKLYGNYPQWQQELATPTADISLLKYLRQTIIHAWSKVIFPTPGVVHLNCPFREPLAPIEDTLNWEIPLDFLTEIIPSYPLSATKTLFSPPPQWLNCEQGIIIAGISQPQSPQIYCQAISNLSTYLGWPILAEALSPLRNYQELVPNLISSYDFILRQPQLAKQLTPQIVIQIGELPTSKQLRQWLSLTNPQRWIITNTQDNLDPLHTATTYLRVDITQLSIPQKTKFSVSDYLQLWCACEAQMGQHIHKTLTSISQLFEGKVSWLLSQHLPAKTPIFIANSMSVRYAEFFWQPNNQQFIPYFSRGTNGIDGTLSTALGIAHANQSSVLLTGDLALLHDTNGFLMTSKLKGHLTIILINNHGGGIFEHLPIAKFPDHFEEFFATPQQVDFASLCKTYGVKYHLIPDWSQFVELLNPLPDTGIRVLELKCDRQQDVQFLSQFNFNQ